MSAPQSLAELATEPHPAPPPVQMVQLLAFELVAPDGAEPHMAKMIDLTMLGMLNGRECTQAEYRLLLERAGFTFDAVTATPTPISIVRALA
ncbi:MAG TPA: methyltransferase [Streptosporangiaceae bacterium]